MMITPDCFDCGGEVDVTAHYPRGPGPKGRLSIRRVNGKYEAYVKWHMTGAEQVLLTTDNLVELVKYTNREGNSKDWVGDGPFDKTDDLPDSPCHPNRTEDWEE